MSGAARDGGHHVLVIGAGIIGVCSACALQQAGFEVTLVDRKAPGRECSFGNAGGMAVAEVMPLSSPGIVWRIPGWLLDPLGPLAIRWGHLPRLLPWLWRFWRAGTPARVEAASNALASLLASTYDDYEPLLEAAGARGLLSRNGSITVYETRRGWEEDALEWETKQARGIRIEHLGPEAIREQEPDLAPVFAGGVRMPDWGHVADPFAVVNAIATHFERGGGTIRRAEVVDFEPHAGRPAAARTASGERLGFDRLVVAAGAWSKALARRLGSRVPLDTERGYNTTLPHPGVRLNNMITSGEGKFVLTPMRMGLRIGGAVELAGLAAPPDFARARALLDRARRFFPRLDTSGGTEWMGYRPSLPDSLPVIGRSPRHANVIFAFGHGHLGLTMGATTARLVTALARGDDPGIDLRPFRVDRF